MGLFEAINTAFWWGDMIRVFNILPVPKPRMTQRDRWAKRPPVVRYRAFCDRVRELGIVVPESGSHITFVLPMPKSWSKKKRAEMQGRPHQQKPDIDNCTKALLDALYTDDSGVWDIRTSKIWGSQGEIIVRNEVAQ